MKESVGSRLKQSHSSTKHVNNHAKNIKHNKLIESSLRKKINSIQKAWDNKSKLLLSRKTALKLKKRLFEKIFKIIKKSISTNLRTLALLTLKYISNSYYWKYSIKDKAKGVSKMYLKRLVNFAFQYVNYAGKKQAKKVVKDCISKLLLISTKLSDKMQYYTQGKIFKLESLMRLLKSKSYKRFAPKNKHYTRLLQQIVQKGPKTKKKAKRMSTKQVMRKMNKLLSIVAPPKGSKAKIDYGAFDKPSAAKKKTNVKASVSKNNAAVKNHAAAKKAAIKAAAFKSVAAKLAAHGALKISKAQKKKP